MNTEIHCRNLPRLPVSGLLATRHDGAPFDDATAAILVEIEAREVATLARRVALLNPAALAGAAMAEYSAELLRRARAWAWLHYSVGNERELPVGAQAFADLAETLETLQEDVEDNGIALSVATDALAAYDVAFGIAERDRGGRYPTAAFDQLCEAEETPIRELCGLLADIADRQWQMNEGFMTPTEAQLAAAEDLISAPFPPAEEDTAT